MYSEPGIEAMACGRELLYVYVYVLIQLARRYEHFYDPTHLNAAARLVFSASRYDHISPLLRQLHWLKAPERVEFKLAVLVYKCRQRTAPSYLFEELCHPADFEARRRLRSASSSSLVVRRTRLSTIDDRAFPVAAARIWNGLPPHVTSAPSHPRCLFFAVV